MLSESRSPFPDMPAATAGTDLEGGAGQSHPTTMVLTRADDNGCHSAAVGPDEPMDLLTSCPDTGLDTPAVTLPLTFPSPVVSPTSMPPNALDDAVSAVALESSPVARRICGWWTPALRRTRGCLPTSVSTPSSTLGWGRPCTPLSERVVPHSAVGNDVGVPCVVTRA